MALSKRSRTPAATAGLVAGLALVASLTGAAAANTAWAGTKSSTGTGSGVGKIVQEYTKSSDATFSATYHVVDSASHTNETITFAQSPPKEAIITPKGSFYINRSVVTVCEGAGQVTCETLPSSLGGVLDGFKQMFAPGNLVNNLKGIEGTIAAHQAGVTVSTSSATYNGLSSTCLLLRGSKYPTPVTYCAANSSGVVDHVDVNGSTITLTAYSSHPSASTFAPPAGAKVVSLPKGA
jgi:hypothetical protein